MLPRLTGIQDSGFRCYRYSPVPNFVQLSVFGLWSLAFQSGCWALIVRFSLVVDRLFVPAATVDFAFSFVGLPLTAPFLPISLDASPFHQLCRVQEY